MIPSVRLSDMDLNVRTGRDVQSSSRPGRTGDTSRYEPGLPPLSEDSSAISPGSGMSISAKLPGVALSTAATTRSTFGLMTQHLDYCAGASALCAANSSTA